MGELRVEVGVKESSKKKLVRSTWAGLLEKMGDGKLAIKINLERVEEELKQNDTRNWRLLTENV